MAAPSGKIGVVGLGSMGFGMACSLLRAGFPTWGMDVDEARTEGFVGQGGRTGRLADVAGTLDILMIVVVDAGQMDAVLFGPGGAAPLMRQGAIVMGCPTINPDKARAFAERLDGMGLRYLDAPISGGAAKAAEGALTVMLSGPPGTVADARPALDAIAAKTFLLGDTAGPASAMKMVNQLLAGVHIAAAAEAITFAMTQGIAPARTVEVIAECAGTSWMFENRGPHIAQGDYAPRSAVDIFVKDLGIVAEMADGARFAAPLAETALAQFTAASRAGLGREDDAAVAKIYARNANLSLPGDDRFS